MLSIIRQLYRPRADI